MRTGIALIKDVHHPRLKTLFEFFHLGVMGGDNENPLMEHVEEIGHIHIADFPGRHEPGTGTADWVAILKFLKDYKYKGYVGFEYYPLRDSDESLHTIRALWDSVMA